MPQVLIDKPGFRIMYLGYLFLSLWLDYFNLFKVRLIINFSEQRKIWRGVFTIITLVDIILSFVIFASIYSFLDYVQMMHQVAVYTGNDNLSMYMNLLTTNIHFFTDDYMLDLTEKLALVIRGPGSNEVSVLFYAGSLPSIWLWLYFVASIVSALIIRSRKLMRFLVYFFNVDCRPLKSIGYVVAMLFFLIYVAIFSIQKIFI
jgi:hypothetical protein